MTVNILPLCSDAKASTANGETTPAARTMGIGSRYWFRTGATANFNNGYITPNNAIETTGYAQNGPYLKTPGICGGEPKTFVFGGNPFGPCCYGGAGDEGGGGELP